MAPRSAKTKKAVDVKVTENEAPKKGRGKAKMIDDMEQNVPDIDIDDKVPVTEKKTKRGKKGNDTNGQLTNGDAPPTKKGKKNLETIEIKTNGDNSAEEGSNPVDDQENGDHTNGNEELVVVTGRGRKKQTKKDDKADSKPAKGRKAKEESTEEKEDINEDKPKGKGRGRKAQPKSELDLEVKDKTDATSVEEDVKTEPSATKGKKKGLTKSAKDRTPESEKDEYEEVVDEKHAENPKKKESKSRKGQGKKAQPKEEVETAEEEPVSKKRKVNKKEEKGDTKEEEIEELPEVKSAKTKRGGKKAELPVEMEEDAQDATTKRRRKPEDKVPAVDSKKKVPLKNKSATDYEGIDFSNSSKTPQGVPWNFKISSWNVDGIRAWINKGGLDYIRHEKPDILCLQETKCAQDKLPDEAANLTGYHAYWLGSDKDGYAGVGIYTTQLAMNVQYGLQNEELDGEGRIITAEYEQFYLICTYVPNAGRGLVTLPKRLQWNDEFRKYVKELDKKKPVIICGDMNVAHNEIDLANPKTNKKNAGFTEEERSGMSDLLGDGFVDTYRHLNPDTKGAYTFWTYMMNSRAKNVGWRLDYFIVSERLLPSLCDNVIRHQVYGSDHCPISLILNLSSADKPKE